MDFSGEQNVDGKRKTRSKYRNGMKMDFSYATSALERCAFWLPDLSDTKDREITIEPHDLGRLFYSFDKEPWSKLLLTLADWLSAKSKVKRLTDAIASVNIMAIADYKQC